MAVDKKISQLASGAPAQAGDEYVVARSGANYKLTLTNIAASMPATTITTGNLNFSSTAQRITGDMTNATVANRLAFQNSVTNGSTQVTLFPNGTSQTSLVRVFNNSDPTNASTGLLYIDSVRVGLDSGITGTGTYLPTTFHTGGSERVRIDTSGNVGIGTASPSYKLDVSTGVAGNIARFTDGVAQTFAVKTNASSIILQNDNSGNIVFNTGAERMRIDSSGNVGIGSSSITRAFANYNQLNINGASGSTIQMQYGGNLASNIVADSNALYVQHIGAISFGIGASGTGTERMRIDSSGNVGIGGTANAWSKLNVTGTYPNSGTTAIPVYADGTIPAAATGQAQIIRTNPTTAAASFTLSNLHHFIAGQQAFGAGSTVSNQYGFSVDSSLTGATNNYGFYSNIASAANRWNFYAAGTANNYFAGEVYCGTTGRINATASPLSSYATTGSGFVVQMTQSANDTISVWNSATTDDNDFIDFYTEGTATLRGNITYNRGAGQVAYNVTSDVRLKENIADAVDAGDKIDAMQVRQFDWKETGNHLDYGFVAQELHNVAPHAVSKPTNDDEMWSVDYSKLVPILVKELQAVRARLATLEAK